MFYISMKQSSLLPSFVGFCELQQSASSATDIKREIQFGKLSSWWPTVLRTVDLNNGLTSCLSRALVSNHVILETALGTWSPNPVQEIIAFPAQPARAGVSNEVLSAGCINYLNSAPDWTTRGGG